LAAVITRPPPGATVALSVPNHVSAWSPKPLPLVVKVQSLERLLLVKSSCHASFQGDPLLLDAAGAAAVDVAVDVAVGLSDGSTRMEVPGLELVAPIAPATPQPVTAVRSAEASTMRRRILLRGWRIIL
jgi:hypothetical protein